MRILFTSHYALPHLGGIEVGIDEVARELTRRGHEVVHVASAAPSPLGPTQRLDEPPYRVVRVPASNVLERRVGVPVPLFGPRLVRVLREEVARADVVHGHGFLYPSTSLGLQIARARHPRAVRVLTEHVGHVLYENPVLDAAQRAGIATVGRATVRAAEAVVVYNAKVERELQRLAGARSVVHIGNGVNLERYRPAEADERLALRRSLGWDEHPRALFVGRLVAKKGLDLAVQAARAAGVPLAVVGPGEFPGPVPEGVELLGALAPERVADLYRAADVFLLPSRGEGFPFTTQEALASGLPAVLADDPSYRRHLDGAGGAVRLAEPTVEAVATSLRDLVSDDAARGRAAHDAAEHARRSFSWARTTDEHERLYADLAGARDRATERPPPRPRGATPG